MDASVKGVLRLVSKKKIISAYYDKMEFFTYLDTCVVGILGIIFFNVWTDQKNG